MLSSDSPVELGLEEGELAGDLYGMEGHQVEGVHLARPADVPLDGRGRALEGDVVTDAVGLRLQLPLDDLVDGLHPLPHRLACKQETRDSLAAVHKHEFAESEGSQRNTESSGSPDLVAGFCW